VLCVTRLTLQPSRTQAPTRGKLTERKTCDEDQPSRAQLSLHPSIFIVGGKSRERCNSNALTYRGPSPGLGLHLRILAPILKHSGEWKDTGSLLVVKQPSAWANECIIWCDVSCLKIQRSMGYYLLSCIDNGTQGYAFLQHFDCFKAISNLIEFVGTLECVIVHSRPLALVCSCRLEPCFLLPHSFCESRLIQRLGLKAHFGVLRKSWECTYVSLL
jgi:hypothetical protein